MEKNDPVSANPAEEPLKTANGGVKTATENQAAEKALNTDDVVVPADADKLVDEASELAKEQTADTPASEPLLASDADVIPANAEKLVNEASELAKEQTADTPASEPLLARDADVIPADAEKLVNEASELAKEETADTPAVQLELPLDADIIPDAADATVNAAAEELREPAPTNMAELIEQAKRVLELDGADITRESINRLRNFYNTLSHPEAKAAEEAKSEDTPESTLPELPSPETVANEEDENFKQILNDIKAKKAAFTARQEEQKAENLKAKNEIIDQINALAEDTDNVNRTFPRYRELQDQFNALGEVPATEETALWKRFQEARERYSDNLKINKELRDYDFKKNLENKELLIAEATKLNEENDIITAFKRLQDLHAKWREIGPVAKELREDIWQKFKDASAEVSKRYQTFFEERKAREVENEQAKTALCVKIEALDWSNLNSFAQWDAMTAEIINAQSEWKTLGFASRKLNTLLFNRFRATCDKFFAAKAEYFKKAKDQMAENLARKTALAEKAEVLKDSTEWKKTTDLLVELQKEWKTIGTVAKKHSDAIWKRFQSACDHFFEQKKAATSTVRQTEHANLQAKRDLIAELEKITPDTPKNEVIQAIANIQSRWKEIGHVPFREKDKVYDQFRAKINEVRKAFDLRESRERMDNFESNISQMEGDQGKLIRERERLARVLETRRTELRTYENNLGFLSAKSKSGNSLVKDFERKIERLKEDIRELEDKIKVLDSKL